MKFVYIYNLRVEISGKIFNFEISLDEKFDVFNECFFIELTEKTVRAIAEKT